jgi:hypothetical protein
MARSSSESAGDGEDPYCGGPRAEEAARAFAGGGSRGQHVVHEDDVATENSLRIGHGKGPSDVPPSGRGIEIRLGSGGSATHQHIGGHRNAPDSLEAPGQEQGLVVAALALAAAV